MRCEHCGEENKGGGFRCCYCGAFLPKATKVGYEIEAKSKATKEKEISKERIQDKWSKRDLSKEGAFVGRALYMFAIGFLAYVLVAIIIVGGQLIFKEQWELGISILLFGPIAPFGFALLLWGFGLIVEQCSKR
ncbi:MAG: hypothetical protein IJX49_03885 [Clostridia bacterium]|nr:hypothetical protein [Clostridia bacterium]